MIPMNAVLETLQTRRPIENRLQLPATYFDACREVLQVACSKGVRVIIDFSPSDTDPVVALITHESPVSAILETAQRLKYDRY